MNEIHSHGPAMAYISHGRADVETLNAVMGSRRRPEAEVRYLVCISKSEISGVGQGHTIDRVRSMRM